MTESTEFEWTPEEAKAILQLETLASDWPQSLMLISAAGSLVVVLTADHCEDERIVEDRAVDIHGIPNDGGDPGMRPVTEKRTRAGS